LCLRLKVTKLLRCSVAVCGFRRASNTFVGTLRGPSERKFPRGPNQTAYGCIVEGKDFRLEFAWWDWTITPVAQHSPMMAAE
jgi:hypothetical protein